MKNRGLAQAPFAEVDAWVDRQKTMLLSKVANGPVLVN
jgi:hypothetical protein